MRTSRMPGMPAPFKKEQPGFVPVHSSKTEEKEYVRQAILEIDSYSDYQNALDDGDI